jgi:hypothetical protein
MRNRAAGAAVVIGAAFVLLMTPFAEAFDTPAARARQTVLCLATMAAYLVTAQGLSRGRTWWPWAAGVAGLLGLGATFAFTRNDAPWSIGHLGANGPLHWLLSAMTVVVAAVPALRHWAGSAPRTD